MTTCILVAAVGGGLLERMALVLVGFIYFAPFTYGWPLSPPRSISILGSAPV
jgi:hypothetical protein